MLRNNKIILTLLVLFVFLQLKSFSQAPLWQWINSDGGFSQEGVRQIATDAQGNIYAIAGTHGSVLFDTLPTLPALGGDDFIVISYTCNGDFRWVQQFGSNINDIPCGLIVTNDGKVLVSGLIEVSNQYSTGSYFGDSVIPPTNNMWKYSFIAQLSSEGHTEWISFPGPTINWDNVRFIQMEQDKNGDISILTWTDDSITWNGFTAPQKGYYLFKFNLADGLLKSIIRLDFRDTRIVPFESAFACFDKDENIYIQSTVYDTIFIGIDTLISPNYLHTLTLIAKFNNTGQYLWHDTIGGIYNSTSFSDCFQIVDTKPVVIGSKMFIGSQTQTFPNSNFKGINIVNSLALYPSKITRSYASFSISDGSFDAVLNFEHREGINSGTLAKKDNSIIAASPSGKLVVINQTDTIKPYYNGGSIGGNYPFVVSMDTGLTHFNWGMSTPILQANASASMNDIHIDHNNNIYLGGTLQGSILNSFGDTTHTLGADFYIAKIAYTNDSCGCEKSIPAVGIVSSSGNILTIKASATNDPDSLYIIWGDGDSSLYTQMNTNISHTYSTTGPWNICVRAYGYCGIEDTCLTNLYSGLYPEDNDKQLTIKVFPNPFQNSFNIKLNAYVNNADLRIYDMMGKEVFQTKISGKEANIPSSHLAKGIYLLELTHSDGMRLRVRLIRD